MEPITAYREAIIDLPWMESKNVIGSFLTSEEWSSERKHLVGRTSLHFVVAVRRVEAAYESLLLRLIADSPDRLHPLTGYVEVRRKTEKTTALNVMLRANLDEEPLRLHLGVRESISSLADVLSGTIAAAARPAGSGLAADDGNDEQARS